MFIGLNFFRHSQPAAARALHAHQIPLHTKDSGDDQSKRKQSGQDTKEKPSRSFKSSHDRFPLTSPSRSRSAQKTLPAARTSAQLSFLFSCFFSGSGRFHICVTRMPAPPFLYGSSPHLPRVLPLCFTVYQKPPLSSIDFYYRSLTFL